MTWGSEAERLAEAYEMIEADYPQPLEYPCNCTRCRGVTDDRETYHDGEVTFGHYGLGAPALRSERANENADANARAA